MAPKNPMGPAAGAVAGFLTAGVCGEDGFFTTLEGLSSDDVLVLGGGGDCSLAGLAFTALGGRPVFFVGFDSGSSSLTDLQKY